MITFTVNPDNENSGVIILNTSTGFALATPTNVLVVEMTGSITGEIASYTMSSGEIADFVNKVAVSLTCVELTDDEYTIFPDDFYRIQVVEKTSALVVVQYSGVATLASYMYIQKSLHDKIVCTPRIIGIYEKLNIHKLFIHLKVLEVLGINPSVSMEDTVVNRINYLKTL